MAKKRLLILIDCYPTLSQTYKENEIKYLYPDFEVVIGSTTPPHAPYRQHFPYQPIRNPDDLLALIKSFQPDIVHGHYVFTADLLHFAAVQSGKFFTVRFHSFDVLGATPDAIRRFLPFLNSDECAGILAFPFMVPYLASLGIKASKLVPDWPVVDYDRFHDRAPNGRSILNTGACIPKKNVEFFVDLAASMRDREFIFYPIEYDRERLIAYNHALGDPVLIKDTVEPYAMAAVYKQCEWLLYTASKELPTVGWPMSIAEAQASGVGVLVQNIRPDLKDYVGDAGYVFDTIDEARDILSRPYPEEMRQAGFEQARRCDIRSNIRKLHRLWGE